MRSRQFICVTAVLLLMAACGSDDNEASPSSAAPTTSAPATTAAPATTETSGTTAAADTTAASATSEAPTGMSDEEWQAIVDAANEEGEVTVYSVQSPEFVDAQATAFAEAYPGIKLNYLRMAPADIQARIESEIESGVVADLIESSTPSFIRPLSEAGNLVAPVGPAFSDPDYPFEDTRATPEAFSAIGSAYVWAWNTDLVPEGIHSWDDYLKLDPGLLGMTDPSIGPAMTDYYRAIEEPGGAGPGFLDKIAAANLEPQIYPGGNPSLAALAAGEIGATLPVFLWTDEEFVGAPMEYGYYEHYWAPIGWSMIIKDSPHPNAAQVYANWLISDDGQQFVADHGGVPVLNGIDSLVPEGVEPRYLEDVTADEAAAFQVRWDDLFG